MFNTLRLLMGSKPAPLPKIEALGPSRCQSAKAERNAILESAAQRLEKGWVKGYLVKGAPRGTDSGMANGQIGAIQEAIASGQEFCLMGALICEVPVHGKAAVQKAIDALSREFSGYSYWRYGDYDNAYGFTFGESCYKFNDSQDDAKPIIEALRAAKAQPFSMEPTTNDKT